MPESKLKYGVSLYSFAKPYFLREMDVPQLIARSKELGFSGYTFVAAQMCKGYPYPTDEFLDAIHEASERNHMDQVCWEGYLDFGMRNDRDLTAEEIEEFTRNDIIYARKAGFHMMKTQHSISPEIFQKMAPFCEKMDVKLCIEMHWPHYPKVKEWQTYLRIMEKSDGWLGVCPDTSIFQKYPHQLEINQALDDGFDPDKLQIILQMMRDDCEKEEILKVCTCDVEKNYVEEYCQMFYRPEAKVGELADLLKYSHMIHGKFYYLADDEHDPCIPYEDIMPLIKKCGYEGYIVSEYEGHHCSVKEDENLQLKRHCKLMKRLYR